MKTALAPVRTIYNHLIASGVRSSVGLTGGIFWLSRPKNSSLEDIVVLPLAMNADALQAGAVNVNIHVPNLSLASDDTQPDFIRMEEIAEVVTSVLQDVWGADYNFRIDEPATPAKDTDGNWFLNILIRYYTINN